MVNYHNWIGRLAACLMLAGLLSSCGFHRKKYENPITKDTQQPDKVLYDKAIRDIERSRFEVARLTLNTLINTYDTSEFLAKAKLAVADSWFREGGAQGLAQAEAEYKDFILFYPTMEEAAESQSKICMIHFKQMEKEDRDQTHALRAENECRQVLLQFPNSKFAPAAEQRLREIQEVLAGGEFKVGAFYHNKGSIAAAANRLDGVVSQYPLYSRAAEALWLEADSYSRMGKTMRQRAGDTYAKIVRDYQLSAYADEARKKLTEMEMPIPDPDPVAVARMKYEMENQSRLGLWSKSTGFIRGSPDVHNAAKSGTPAMTNVRPAIPVSVPQVGGPIGFSGEVTASTVGDSSALTNNPDARLNPPKTPEEAAKAGVVTDPTAVAGSQDKKDATQKGKKPKTNTKKDKKKDKNDTNKKDGDKTTPTGSSDR